jgi:hypothetical protein
MVLRAEMHRQPRCIVKPAVGTDRAREPSIALNEPKFNPSLCDIAG